MPFIFVPPVFNFSEVISNPCSCKIALQILSPNPFVSLRDKVTPRIITLMNELGLTPRGRLQNNSNENADLGDLMRGPEHYLK